MFEVCLVVIRILYTFIHWIYFACNYTCVFLVPMAKKRNNVTVLILYQITVLLPKDRNMQKAGFLMTRLKITLAVNVTESYDKNG